MAERHRGELPEPYPEVLRMELISDVTSRSSPSNHQNDKATLDYRWP
jgi:hypothetical protein